MFTFTIDVTSIRTKEFQLTMSPLLPASSLGRNPLAISQFSGVIKLKGSKGVGISWEALPAKLKAYGGSKRNRHTQLFFERRKEGWGRENGF